MVTLFRWILLKQKEIKWKLAFYQFLDKQLKKPEEFETKIIEELAEIIHKTTESSE